MDKELYPSKKKSTRERRERESKCPSPSRPIKAALDRCVAAFNLHLHEYQEIKKLTAPFLATSVKAERSSTRVRDYVHVQWQALVIISATNLCRIKWPSATVHGRQSPHKLSFPSAHPPQPLAPAAADVSAPFPSPLFLFPLLRLLALPKACLTFQVDLFSVKTSFNFFFPQPSAAQQHCLAMDGAVEEKSGNGDHEIDGEASGGDLFSESAEEERCGSTSSLETSCSEETHESGCTQQSAAPGWPLKKSSVPALVMDVEKDCERDANAIENLKPKCSAPSDIEMMKERFSKLLLGEDMSGSGKGVCTALAISNAITNLCATIFGQLWRLEPLPSEKKAMWRREMEWLLCVSDHIVEMIPSWQTFPDGSKLEIMTCRPRTDLFINLPALRKLENMLLEVLDSFTETEFWYIDQGVLARDADGSASFRSLHRQEEKWWLPVPRVPPGGLKTRKQLQHKRDCTSQILKAAMAINSNALAEMEVPEPYLAALPKNGRTSLGDLMYRYIASDQFSPECLLDCLDLSSEHQVLEVANRVEASIYIWRRRTSAKPVNSRNCSNASTKSSWGIVKDMIVEPEHKRELLADRAETLLLCLKQRFPSLTQTSLDTSKIQFNKDIGKSILESYSRVLESLAFNIVARIDDLLHVDDFCKHSDHLPSVPTVGLIAQKKVPAPPPFAVPLPGTATPYTTAYGTPCFSPAPLISPARRERSPLISNNNNNKRCSNRGFGVKKVLTSYLSAHEHKMIKSSSDVIEPAEPVISSRNSAACLLD